MTSTEIEENEMSHAALGPAVNDDKAALATPLVEFLARLVRAHESSGSRKGKSDPELLADFIITKELRRKFDHRRSDPDALWRLDMFYTAVGLAIEERGVMASPTRR